MAGENEKGKGKVKEPEGESPGQTKSGGGRLQEGKWFGDCDRKANCFTVNNVSKRTYGDKFWACSRLTPYKCKFLWDLDQEQARERHTEYGPPPPAPETPKADEQIAEGPRSPPKKRYQTEDETGGPSNRNLEVAGLSSFKDLDPSRKVVKTTRFATPGRADQTTNAEDSLPTPDTGGRALGVTSGSRSRMSRGAAAPPQLSDAIIMRNERKSSLSAEVLKLIRSEKFGQKESVEIQIEHEIDTEVVLYEQKLRGYEKTNKTCQGDSTKWST